MESLRENIRDTKLAERQKQRESLLNRNRDVTLQKGSEISKQDLIEKCNLLKVRSAVSCELLSSLKHALLVKENVSIFMQVDGALQALVRALSGQHAKFQLYAACCLCNLALGDEKTGRQVAKVAGMYLVLHLDGMSPYLTETCLWTLGNICSQGAKCVRLVKTQGALPSLAHLLLHQDDNIRTAVIYSLTQILYHGFDVLEAADFQLLLAPVLTSSKKDSAAAYLLCSLSSNTSLHGRMMEENLHTTALRSLIQPQSDPQINTLTACLRMVGNIIAEPSGRAAIQCLELLTNVQDPFTSLLSMKCSHLIKEFVWLLRNFSCHPNVEVQTGFWSVYPKFSRNVTEIMMVVQ